ncbi:hypothetical protein EJ05DRAFT_476079 [Pseudovirgaria hyperparasitica]|uniref:Mid2 domain-containing protein n=1 Tax=Pseudovirgaria hyperparasitica TaxID=470096 RepID=A0A6A6WAB4_9PEZI|nr:uncharacterized protein EJ05DRAFT_476079 [Pseudovirgaria hyperparasitica]KAF2758766.1 hypothetical protein EJ05DRAFT_476079 [Pseudovirgaria hyperparasitica]
MYSIDILSLVALWQLLSFGSAQDVTTDPAFFGFSYGSDEIYTPAICNSDLEWKTYRDFGGCMDPTNDPSTAVVLDCNAGTMTFAGSTLDCTSRFDPATESATYDACASFLVKDDETDTDLLTRYYCNTVATSEVYTMTIPAGVTYVDESGDIFTIPSSNTPSSSPSPVSTLPGPTTTAPGPVPCTSCRKRNMSWIAGAVAGPIVGIALIGAGVFCCLRRRRNRESSAANNLAYAPQTSHQSPPEKTAAMASSYPSPNSTNSYYGQNPVSPYQPAFSTSSPPPPVSPVNTGHQSQIYPSSPAPQYDPLQNSQQHQGAYAPPEKPTNNYVSPHQTGVSELDDGSTTRQ